MFASHDVSPKSFVLDIVVLQLWSVESGCQLHSSVEHDIPLSRRAWWYQRILDSRVLHAREVEESLTWPRPRLQFRYNIPSLSQLTRELDTNSRFHFVSTSTFWIYAGNFYLGDTYVWLSLDRRLHKIQVRFTFQEKLDEEQKIAECNGEKSNLLIGRPLIRLRLPKFQFTLIIRQYSRKIICLLPYQVTCNSAPVEIA